MKQYYLDCCSAGKNDLEYFGCLSQTLQIAACRQGENTTVDKDYAVLICWLTEALRAGDLARHRWKIFLVFCVEIASECILWCSFLAFLGPSFSEVCKSNVVLTFLEIPFAFYSSRLKCGNIYKCWTDIFMQCLIPITSMMWKLSCLHPFGSVLHSLSCIRSVFADFNCFNAALTQILVILKTQICYIKSKDMISNWSWQFLG